MGVDLDEKELSMAILNAFFVQFENLIRNLDALGEDGGSFTHGKEKSLALQEEQRRKMGGQNCIEEEFITYY